ncbi:MAG: hypothetical protein JKY34_11765 [Kordiimonadaceae bacterium]|nr:hypothetical protein [Kordiimonadaceae bacterium]
MHKNVFSDVRRATCMRLGEIVPSILPQGRRMGREWVALNPTRADRSLGSFRVNLSSGAWADFATGDRGGDLTSLASYLYGISQYEAALYVSRIAGVANGR